MLSRAQELLSSPPPSVPGFPGYSSLYTGGQRPGEARVGPGGGPMLHTGHTSPLLSQTAAPEQSAASFPSSRASPGIQETEPMQL